MAAAGVRRFDHFCAGCEIVPVTEQIVVRAADIYADLYQRGELIGDADILIAATAMINGFVIASNNAAHFGRITGLQIDNWSI